MTKDEHPDEQKVDEQKVDEQKVDERAKITAALQQALGQQDNESISISDLFKAINISGSAISGSAIGRNISKRRHSYQADLPPDFIDLLNKLTLESQLDETTIIKQGLVFVSLAIKVKQQGFRIAIVDSDGTVIANVDGF